MKNLTKPALAAATVAALVSGLALTQGGVANAATPSDCAVAVSLPTTPVSLTTAATTSLDVTTTWTGACTTEAKTAAATFSFVSAPSTDASAVSTPIPTAGTVTSRTLALGSGVTTISVPTSALPVAGSYIQLKRAAAPTGTTATTEPEADTVVTATSNQEVVKNGTSSNIKFSRSGKTATFVGHAYSYTPAVAPATTGSNVGQSEQRVRLQKLVGTEYTTVATTTTSSTGRYEFALSDTTGSSYRLATTETATAAESVSPVIVATVDPHSATKVIRLHTVKVAKKVTVSGTLYTLKPVETKYKGTTGVAAYFQKKLDGSWVTIKKVRSTTGGAISGVANNVHKTTYRFVVIANSKYTTSTSASISR